jgi:YebC/PmpR family DNA-binding regulatory protein
MGGGDVDGNPRLRSAVLAARGANMPKDNIDRAIQRGTGELDGVTYEEITYEGYGPEGVAILVDTLTDNTNRTVSEVRSAFNKRGGKMAEPGSVAWMFDEKGQIRIAKSAADFDRVFESALEAGAEDVEDAGDEEWLITTAREELYVVLAELETAELAPHEAKLAKVPQTMLAISDVAAARKILALIDAIEDSADVQTVWANFDVSEEVMNQLEEN